MMAPVTPNQAIDLIASGGYKLPFGRLNRYSVAMRLSLATPHLFSLDGANVDARIRL
jgi:hypothetical protein